MIALLLSIALAQEIRVMVIDTGLSVKATKVHEYLHDSQKNKVITDEHSHGTHVAGLVLFGNYIKDPVCKNVKLFACKYNYKESLTTDSTVMECMAEAILNNVHFVNFSSVGEEKYLLEELMIKILTKSGAKVIVAAGNSNKNLSKSKMYPAAYNIEGMFTVGNGVSESERDPRSNFGLGNMVWRDGQKTVSFGLDGKSLVMSGSSMSAAIYTHELLKKACKEVK